MGEISRLVSDLILGGVLEAFWDGFGRVLGSIWGRFWDHVWTMLGLIWGYFWDGFWTARGQQIQADAGQMLGESWPDPGQMLWRSWAQLGQMLGSSWADAGQILGKSWVDAGHISTSIASLSALPVPMLSQFSASCSAFEYDALNGMELCANI